jgi:hypothetical protein
MLRVLGRLRDELPDAGAHDRQGEAHPTLAEKGWTAGVLGAEDVALMTKVREALAELAARLSADGEGPPAEAVAATLDAAEMAVLGELVFEREDRLPQLMPGLVFLVALPISGQERALELSHRATALIEERKR